MSELLIALTGIVAGALASGGLQTLQAVRERKMRVRVAARLLNGDLYLAEHSLKEIAERGKWPDKTEPDFSVLLDTWNSQREALAAGVNTTEWNDVAIACRALVDMPGARKPGEVLDPESVRTLGNVVRNLDRASTVTLRHSAGRRDRDRYVAVVLARRAEAGHADTSSTTSTETPAGSLPPS